MRLVVTLRAVLALVCITAAGLLTLSEAQALDRKVNVINGTTFPIKNLYATPAGKEIPRKNLLPTSSQIPAGESKTLDFDFGTTGAGSCMRDLVFDLTGYSQPGGMLSLPNVDVCKASKLRLYQCDPRADPKKASTKYCAKSE